MPVPYSVFTPVHDPGVPGEFVGDAYMRPAGVAVNGRLVGRGLAPSVNLPPTPILK